MTVNTTLKAELVEVFKHQAERSIRATFAELRHTFGETMRGVCNSRSYRVWVETVRPCCDSQQLSPISPDLTYSLSSERLANVVARVASQMADEVLAKVDAKVGELSDAEVTRVGGANFIITGAKHDRAVRIEQNQIINISTKGKLFNQYPSRIYVDGKFTSAAKFAAI